MSQSSPSFNYVSAEVPGASWGPLFIKPFMKTTQVGWIFCHTYIAVHKAPGHLWESIKKDRRAESGEGKWNQARIINIRTCKACYKTGLAEADLWKPKEYVDFKKANLNKGGDGARCRCLMTKERSKRRADSVYHHRKWHVINFSNSSSQQQSPVC